MRHEVESWSLDSSERSDNNDDDDEGTGAKDKNCYGNSDGDGGGDRNTGARGGSTECLGFLSLSAITEAFNAMAKSKASSSTKLIKIEVRKK